MTVEAEYKREILAWMMIQESRLPTVYLRSPQMPQRRQIVDWTCIQCEKLGFPKTTTNLAIGKSYF